MDMDMDMVMDVDEGRVLVVMEPNMDMDIYMEGVVVVEHEDVVVVVRMVARVVRRVEV